MEKKANQIRCLPQYSVQWPLGLHTQTPRKTPAIRRKHCKKKTGITLRLDGKIFIRSYFETVLFSKLHNGSSSFPGRVCGIKHLEQRGVSLLLQRFHMFAGGNWVKTEGLTATCPPSTLRYCRTSFSADIAHWLWKGTRSVTACSLQEIIFQKEQNLILTCHFLY